MQYPDVKAKLDLGVYKLNEYPPIDVAAKLTTIYYGEAVKLSKESVFSIGRVMYARTDFKDDLFQEIYLMLMKQNIREISTNFEHPVPLYLTKDDIVDFKGLKAYVHNDIMNLIAPDRATFHTVLYTNAKDTIEKASSMLKEVRKNSLNSEYEKFNKDINAAISALNRATKDLQNVQPMEGQMNVFDFIEEDDYEEERG